MRAGVAAGVALALWTSPAAAFDNEYQAGPLHQEHGHGELVRRAVVGTPFEPRAAELVQGQRDLDFPAAARGSLDMGLGDWWHALVSGFGPDEQKKHALRWYSGLPAWRAVTRPLSVDWADVVAYLGGELRAARHAPAGSEATFLGHALHTLQDSYAPAHVERTPEGRVRDVAYYPGRHRLVDERDAILTPEGALTPEASAAIQASHELLAGYARWRGADDAAFERWVAGFTGQYMALETP